MQKIVLMILFSFIATVGYAAEFMPADQAFVFSATLNQNNQLVMQWNIAPGYYLYRNQLLLKTTPMSGIQLGKIELPAGEPKHDMVHGQFQAYTGSIKIAVPLINKTNNILNLHINYQGCSSGGFCYTPIKKLLIVDLSRHTAPYNLTPYVKNLTATAAHISQSDTIADFFQDRNFILIVCAFLGLGLLLAFTPCVLPMIPILSSIIVGSGKKTKRKSFFLSLAYVAGMAITYAIVGVVIALIGSNIQAELQKPWVIILFSGLFVLLALSLFGFYELQLPSRLRHLITTKSNRLTGGTYVSVFLMGSLSTLIVSPCVSAPLVGVLAYIGQSGDVLLGAIALLALGIGMGIPLLLIGVSADRILPKAGPWMKTIERLFGVMMLCIAIWMLSRMVAGPVTLFLWAILCIFAAIFIGVFSPVPRFMQWVVKGASVIALVYGVILLIGAVMGNTNPLQPWETFETQSQVAKKKLSFVVVHSLKELKQQLDRAQKAQRPVLLDFYADWCVSCVLIDRTVFSRSDVQDAIDKFTLLRVDITKDTATDSVMLEHFDVIGPPTIIFFNAQGQELTAERIVGEVSAKEFLSTVQEIK